MSRLRWAEANHGCRDLLDENGTIRGYVMAMGKKFRGYIVERNERLARFVSMQDFPAFDRACDWVEQTVQGKPS